MKSDQEKKNDLRDAILNEWADWERRHKTRIQQNQLAVKIGISPNTFSRFVGAESLPDVKNYLALVAFFGHPISDALEWPRMLPDDPIMAEVAKEWHTLDEDQKEALLQNLRELKEQSTIPARTPVTA